MKLRGRSRYTKRLETFVQTHAAGFPEEQLYADGEARGYWHAHLPLPWHAFLFGNSRRALRRQTVDALLAAAAHLVRNKPAAYATARVVAVLTLPNLAHSQLVVFYSERYFAQFAPRADPEQTWTPLAASRSFAREWHRTLPDGFAERGYREVSRDADASIRSDVWLIGELGAATAV